MSTSDFPIAVGEWRSCEVFQAASGRGNPTTVFRLKDWPTVRRLVEMAKISRSPETTFVVAAEDKLEIRWLLHDREVPLCGHAALAVADLFRPGLSSGETRDVSNVPRLKLTAEGILLPLPELQKVDGDFRHLGLPVTEVYATERDYLLVVEDWESLRTYRVDDRLRSLDRIGCLLTSPHPTFDVALRFFVPRPNLFEDLGSASVIPALQAYWQRFRPVETFFQGSKAGVLIRSRLVRNSVQISGVVTWLERGRWS